MYISIYDNNYELRKIALIDLEANLNCIQERLVPTQYYEKKLMNDYMEPILKN